MRILLTLLLILNCSFSYAADLVLKDVVVKDCSLRTDYTDYTQDANCVGVWRFNADLHDTAIDTSGNDKHGIYQANTFSTTGKVGQCIQLDGVNDGTHNSFRNMGGWTGLTAAAWVNYDSSGTDEHTIISNFNVNTACILFRLEPSDDTVEGFIYTVGDTLTGGTFTGSSVPANTWTHVVLVYDKVSLKCYVNGVVNGTTFADIDNFDANDSGVDLRIGLSPHAPDDDFTGKIDEVVLLDRALSATEVYDLYKYGIK